MCPLAPITSEKENTSVNAIFLQNVMCHAPFSARHHFFPTLPIIWAQVEAKRFLQKPR
jgi:hypothetical protein